MNLAELVAKVKSSPAPRVVVVGDFMVDDRWTGSCTRQSPESDAVPVLSAGCVNPIASAGGAGAVALMLRGLGCEVLAVVAGASDYAGDTLVGQLRSAGCGVQNLIARKFTTRKLRFFDQVSAKQLLRYDIEDTEPLSDARAFDLARLIQPCEAIVIADYSKGVCTPEFVRLVMERARDLQVPVFVDPGRWAGSRYDKYPALVKYNRVEALARCPELDGVAEDCTAVPSAVSISGRSARGSVVVVTDGERGMALAEGGRLRGEAIGLAGVAHGRAVPVIDVCGAGDMALAGLVRGYLAGLRESELLAFANLAASVKVGKVGAVPVSWDELTEAAGPLPVVAAPPRPGFVKVLRDQNELWNLVDCLHADRKKIVFTNGCFDMLHPGHLHLLQTAKSLGERLIVAVDSDASVKRLKGAGRPIIKCEDRMNMLAALECVDYVFAFESYDLADLLRYIKPAVLVKGSTSGGVSCRDVVKNDGGQVVVVPAVDGYSTTSLFNRAG
jgi:D-beta-D-heptose 7-phosphate kinase / D-beta-D-heptose 1-phosphate adenosyltransferase